MNRNRKSFFVLLLMAMLCLFQSVSAEGTQETNADNQEETNEGSLPTPLGSEDPSTDQEETPTDIQVSITGTFTYNGLEQKPEITVTYNDSELEVGTDYTLEFTNNVNAGTAKVTVIPSESASFTQKDTEFTIAPATITVTGGTATKVYNGSVNITATTTITPTFTGKVGNDAISVSVKTGKFAQKGAGETELNVTEFQLEGDEDILKNYTLATNKPALSATIEQKEVELVWSTPVSFDYDGTEKEVTATVSPASIVEDDEVTVSEYTGNKSAEKGEHTATATALSNSNYKLPDNASIDWVITNGLVITGLDDEFVYNGKEQQPDITVTYNDSKLKEGTDYTLTFTDNVNAGTAKVSVIPSEDATFSQKDAEFTIAPATITVTGGSATKVYDGSVNITATTTITPTFTGKVGEDAISVSVKAGEFAQKEAGETELIVTEFRLEGDEATVSNYILADQKPAFPATIGQKEVELTWSTPTSFDYDGTEKEVTATVNPASIVEDDEVTVSEYTDNKSAEKGEHTATATALSNGNYKLPDNASIDWVITSGLVITGLDDEFVYNGKEQQPAITVTYNDSKLKEGTDYTLTFTDNVNAGTAKVSVIPSEDATFSQKDAEFTIAPATITVTGGTATKVYDGSVNITAATTITPTFSGKVGEDAISVSVKAGEFAQKEAGETELTVTEFQLVGDEDILNNYKLDDEVPALTATIEPKEVELTWSTPTSFDYDGTEKEVTATVNPASIVEDDEVTVSEYTGNKSAEKGEHTATATALSNSNYKLPDNASIDWVITNGLVITGLDDEFVYNGKEQQPDITVTYNDSKLKEGTDYTLTFTDNVNAGTAKVSVIPSEDATFSQKDAEFTIAPATITVTGGSATKVYDGSVNITATTTITPTFTGKVGEDAISVSVKAGEFAQKEAGETELTVTEFQLVGDEDILNNYKLDEEVPALTATIEPKEVELTWSTPTSFDYDGTEKEVTATVNPASIVEDDEVTVSEYTGNKSAEKGEHTATATALSNSNYKLPDNASIDWVITSGLVITGLDDEFVYNGKEQQPAITVTYNDSKLKEGTDYTLTFTDNVNAGTAKVSVIPSEDATFSQKDAEFTIAPATITVTGGTATKVYDGSVNITAATTINPTFKGKVGEDAISVSVKEGEFAQKEAGETELIVTEFQLEGDEATVSNYILADQKPAFPATIGQKEVELTWSTPTTFIVDGKEKEVTAKVNPSSIVEGDKVAVETYTGNKAAEKGKYIAYAISLNNDNYKLPANASLLWEILSGLVITGLEEPLTYNGTEQEPLISVSYNDVKLVDKTDYTVEYTDNINAGTATVTIIPASIDSTGATLFNQKDLHFTINPAVITVTGGTALKVYDGSDKLTAETEISTTFTGKVGEEDIDVTVKEGLFAQKNAGETELDVTKFQLKGTAAASGNYILATEKPVLSAEIARKEVSLIWSTPTTFAYDGKEKEVTATVNPASIIEGDEVSVKTYTDNKSAEKGEHTATATALSNDNYKLPDNASKVWEITNGLEITGPTDALTYNGKEQQPEVTVKYNDTKLVEGTDYILEYADNINAGTAKVSVIPTKISTFTRKEIEFTINPAVISVTGGTATKVYDGNDKFTAETATTLTIAGKVDKDDVSVIVKDGHFAQRSAGETELEVTQYQLAGEDAASGNYTLAAAKPTLTAVIEPKEVALIWSTTTTFFFNGEEKEVTATIDATSVIAGDKVIVLTYTGNKSAEKGEHTATATALNNDNYKLPTDASIIWEITSGLEITGPDEVLTYNGKEQRPKVTVKYNDTKLVEKTDYILEYSDNINAGTAKVSVIPTKDSNFSQKDITFTITPAVITVTGGTATKVYDGNTDFTTETVAKPDFTGTIGTDDITVTVKSGVFVQKDAGETELEVTKYQLSGEDAASGNYTLVAESTTLAAVIEPKEVALTWSTPTTFAFDGKEKEVTATVKPSSIVEGDEVSVSAYTGNKSAEKGEHTATATALSNDNYKLPDNASKDWEITNGLEITGPTDALTYNGKEQKPEVAVKYNDTKLVEGTDYILEYSDNINAGTAKVSVIPTKDLTFTQKTIEFTINPAIITVTGGTATKVYDGSDNVTPATVVTPIFTGKVGTDDITVTIKNGVFAQKEAGETELNVTEMLLEGSESATGNYFLAITKPTFNAVIEQKEVSLVWSTPTTFAYDGEEKEVTATIDASTIAEGDEVSVLAYTENKSAEKGEYTATATALSNDNYKLPANASIVWEITSGLEITGPAEVLTYNGKEQMPEVTVKFNDIELTNKTDYTLAYTDNINAGTAKVSIIPTKDSTFTQKTIEFTINPAVITVTGGTAAKVYDGNADVTPETVIKPTYTGAVGEEDVTVTVKAGTFAQKEAGSTELVVTEYQLAGQDAASGNYILAEEKPVLTAEIKQKEVELVWSTPTTFVYDGEEKEVTATVKPSSIVEGDEVNVSAYTGNKSSEKGEYTATVDALSNTNYKLPANAYTNWEIVTNNVPATDYSITIKVPSEGYVYDKQAKEPAVEVRIGDKLIASSEYELQYTANTGAGKAKVTISAKEGANYNFAKKEATFDIAKAVITITPVIADKEYDGTTNATIALKTSGILKGDDATAVATATYKNKNAGTDKPVKITYSIEGADKGNYQLAKATTDTVASILPKAIDLVWSEKEYTYDGTQKSVTVIDFIGLVENDEVTVKEYSNQTKTNAGNYTAKAGKLSNQNYTIGSGEEFEWTISAKKADINIALSDDEFVYNGKEQVPTITVKDGKTVIPAENYTITYDDNINAGKVTYTVKANEGGNYQFDVQEGSYEIKPVAITLESASKTWLYDGIAHTMRVVTITEGELVGDEGFDITVTGVITAIGKVDNEFTIKPKKGTLASNYAITQKIGVLTVTPNMIAPITTDPETGEKTIIDPVTGEIVPLTDPNLGYEIVVNPSHADIIYGGVAQEPEVDLFINGTKIPENEYTLVYKNNTNAGTAKVTIVNKDGVYTLMETTVEFTIQPRELSIEWGETELTYNGKRQKLTYTLSEIVNGDKVKAIVKGDTATNANSYKAIVSGVDNKNYTLKADTAKWVILKADREMPELTPIAETEAGTKDGRIDGLRKDMEIMKDGEKKFTPVTDPKMKLEPGDYYVRLAENANYNASETVLVTVPSGATPYVLEAIVVSDFGYCPETEDKIRYEVEGDSHPAAYRITYSKEAEAAGFKSTGFIAIEENGILPITIPDCDANTYKAKLEFRSKNKVVSKAYDIELTVNLSEHYMVDIFDDVISAVNTEERFLEYQWYHNDILLEGETKPFYNQNKTLNGSYYMEVLTVDDRRLKTCKLNFETQEADKLTAYPNPTHDYTTIELSNDNEEEHKLEVFSSAGENVKSDVFTGTKTEVNFVDLPAGVYIVKVDGLEVKVLKY